MIRTWRWFGDNDPVTLDMLRQIGVQGVVTSLHGVPAGEVWSVGAIEAEKRKIEAAGLEWSVVESLPVSEEIKYASPRRDRLIDNYILSLENLGRCGIRRVCYNFMPVIDWIRTDLSHQLPDGTSTLYFDRVRFAYFDCRILQREGAAKDYTPQELEKVAQLDATITEDEKAALVDTIIVKTQGFVNSSFKDIGTENDPVRIFKEQLALYKGVDKETLRANLKFFLERIMPVCDRYGIDMCIHPDDPPRAVLGLPRIVTDTADIDWILSAVDNPHNGLTFCAGSLSSGAHNDVAEMARRFVARTRFVHLRSTAPDEEGNFIESSHLDGAGQLTEIIPIFESCADARLPFRVDHGRLMLGDGSVPYNPGYSFHGRMFALAEVMGMIAMAGKQAENRI